MFISKKKHEQAIKEAYEKGFCESDKMHYQGREAEDLRREIRELRERVTKLENKGKKPRFRCPCMVFSANR